MNPIITKDERTFNLITNYCDSGRSSFLRPKGVEADLHLALTFVQRIINEEIRNDAFSMIALSYKSLGDHYRLDGDAQRAALYYNTAMEVVASRIDDDDKFKEVMEEILSLETDSSSTEESE